MEEKIGVVPSMQGKIDVVPSMKGKIRTDWLKIGIAAGIVVVIILGIIWITSLSKHSVISAGDTVKFDFTIKPSDGKEISNSTQLKVGSIAQSFGFLTNKLDEVLGNISIGEKKTVTLSADDAFGPYDDTKVIIENRTSIIGNTSVRDINRTFNVPSATFNQVFGEDAVLNKQYTSSSMIWTAKATEVSNESVKMSIENKAGEKLNVDAAMYVEIVGVSTDKIKIKLGADEKTVSTPNGNYSIKVAGTDIIATWNPVIGQEVDYGYSIVKVKSFNDTSVILDANNPYAGQNITITLKAESIVRKASVSNSSSSSAAKISGAPTLQTFVMTHCPYGTQMEKGVIPAYKLLKDKANFEIRFVSYTMHGDKEDTETKRQLCIREETSKFWEYLECFLQDETYASKCMQESGLDENSINDCMNSRAAGYWDEDKALNEQYGVQGSPTTVLDGVEKQIYPRSPEDVKKAVCGSFSSQPSECSQTLDSSNPSPGFGFSTSSSASSASCG